MAEGTLPHLNYSHRTDQEPIRRNSRAIRGERDPSLTLGISEQSYFPDPAAIFFTMARTSLRSLSLRLMV